MERLVYNQCTRRLVSFWRANAANHIAVANSSSATAEAKRSRPLKSSRKRTPAKSANHKLMNLTRGMTAEQNAIDAIEQKRGRCRAYK